MDHKSKRCFHMAEGGLVGNVEALSTSVVGKFFCQDHYIILSLTLIQEIMAIKRKVTRDIYREIRQ